MNNVHSLKRTPYISAEIDNFWLISSNFYLKAYCKQQKKWPDAGPKLENSLFVLNLPKLFVLVRLGNYFIIFCFCVLS